MLAKLVEHTEWRMPRDGEKKLESTRATLEIFLQKKGKKYQAPLFEKVLKGASDNTYLQIPLRMKKKDFSLIISTFSLLGPMDEPKPILIHLVPYIRGREAELKLPTKREYLILGFYERLQVDHNVVLIQKDLIPFLQKKLSG